MNYTISSVEDSSALSDIQTDTDWSLDHEMFNPFLKLPTEV